MNYATGDILLYHGTKTGFEKFVECASGSRYSHASMVVVIPNPAFENTSLENGVYVIESTQSGNPDAEGDGWTLGVHMTKLENVLAEKGQEIYHRRLNCVRDTQFYENLKRAHSVVHDCPYDFLPQDWFNAFTNEWCNWTIPCVKKQRTNTFWCSALVAYLYVQLDLLPKTTWWTDVAPKDLGVRGKLKFINCQLHSEEQL